MSASRTSVETESRPSGPTLDLHTDAIILREGAGAVGSAYLRGSSSCPSLATTPTVAPRPTPTPTPTSMSVATVTPTSAEPSPFLVRKTVFRAAPAVITVRPGPATERARARRAAMASTVSSAGRGPAARGARRPVSSTWPFFAAFALGAAMAASAQMTVGRGVELAVIAAVIAGVQTFAAAFPGKARAQSGPDRR